MLLVAANSQLGDALGTAMIDGQLYFAGLVDLSAVLVLVIPIAVLLPWLGRRLLRACFFPRFEQANALPAWRWHLGLDLSAATGIAVDTATLGLMGPLPWSLSPPDSPFASHAAGIGRCSLRPCQDSAVI